MVKPEEVVLKEGLYYTKTHEWCRIEDDIAVVGVTDYAAKVMSDVVYLELPEVEDIVTQGEPCGTIESVKAAEDIYSPVSGRIVEVNEIAESPEKINSDPYNSWLFKIKLTNKKEVLNLLSKDDYFNLLKKELKEE